MRMSKSKHVKAHFSGEFVCGVPWSNETADLRGREDTRREEVSKIMTRVLRQSTQNMLWFTPDEFGPLGEPL